MSQQATNVIVLRCLQKHAGSTKDKLELFDPVTAFAFFEMIMLFIEQCQEAGADKILERAVRPSFRQRRDAINGVQDELEYTRREARRMVNAGAEAAAETNAAELQGMIDEQNE